jgi:uncharacterized protein YbaP (TraB family)
VRRPRGAAARAPASPRLLPHARAPKPVRPAAPAAGCDGIAAPLLWKVSDQDNRSTCSAPSTRSSRATTRWRRASTPLRDAELVGFECRRKKMNSEELGMQMMQAAMQPEGGSLEAALDPATWKRVQAYCQSRNQPIEAFQMLEPWMVSLVISLGEMGRVGYDPKQGLDQQLIARADEAHKHTMGLETGASQIAVLDGMSKVEQRQALNEALDDADDQHALDELHDLWRRGDAAALESKLTVEFKGAYGPLYQRINVDRNQAWIPKISAMLDDSHSDDALVVVGTMHLLGPDGPRQPAAGKRLPGGAAVTATRSMQSTGQGGRHSRSPCTAPR